MNDLCSKNAVYQRWLAGDAQLWPEVEAAIKEFLRQNICNHFPGFNGEEKVEFQVASLLVFEGLMKAKRLQFENRGTFADACALVMRSVLVEMANSNIPKSQPQAR